MFHCSYRSHILGDAKCNGSGYLFLNPLNSVTFVNICINSCCVEVSLDTYPSEYINRRFKVWPLKRFIQSVKCYLHSSQNASKPQIRNYFWVLLGVCRLSVFTWAVHELVRWRDMTRQRCTLYVFFFKTKVHEWEVQTKITYMSKMM